jgi:hypothetical protein
MTLPRSVRDVLTDHVQFEIECIDRIYLNVFVPELQRTGQVAGSLMRHRGVPDRLDRVGRADVPSSSSLTSRTTPRLTTRRWSTSPRASARTT